MRIHELLEEQDINEGIWSRLGSRLIPGRVSTAGRAATTAIKGSSAALAEGAGDAVKLLTKLGLWFPFQQYFENMDNAEAQVKAGQMTNDEYEEQHRNQLGILISTLAAALAGSTLIKSAEAFFSLLRVLPVIGKPIAYLVSGLSNVAQLYFMKELVSDEGRTMLASFISTGVLKGIGFLGLKAFPYFKSLVSKASDAAGEESQTLSKTASNLANDPSKIFKQQHAQQTAPAAATSEPAKTEPAATSEPDKTEPKLNKQDEKPSKSSGFAPIGMKRDAQGNLVIDPDA